MLPSAMKQTVVLEPETPAFFDEKQAKKGWTDVIGHGFHVVALNVEKPSVVEPLNTSDSEA